MKLTCPECGFVGSATAWNGDAAAREALVEIVKLPAEIAMVVLPYLGMFRPRKNGLNWRRAKNIVADLARLTAVGHVRIQGQVSRPCPPRLWAEAVEQMTARREAIRRPLRNHNYLRQVAYDLADRADAGQEADYHQAARAGNARTSSEPAHIRRAMAHNPYFDLDDQGATDADKG